MNKELEKFEIRKGDNSYYYTGHIKPIGNGRVEIRTIKGETIRVWKEQVLGSQVLDKKGDDNNGISG